MHKNPNEYLLVFLLLQKSTSPVPPVVTERGSPVPCSSTSQPPPAASQRPAAAEALGLGSDFRLNETESFMNNLPADMFGLQNEWGERDALLAQVLAASQQEYFDSLKRRRHEADSSASTSPANSRPDTPK